MTNITPVSKTDELSLNSVWKSTNCFPKIDFGFLSHMDEMSVKWNTRLDKTQITFFAGFLLIYEVDPYYLRSRHYCQLHLIDSWT